MYSVHKQIRVSQILNSENNNQIHNEISKNDKLKFKHQNLFHKYVLNLREPNKDIEYSIIKKENLTKKYICHIHCFNLNSFDIMFEQFIKTINHYFDIIITFTHFDKLILEKYTEFTYIQVKNYGMDIGPKFVINNYLTFINYTNYTHIFYIHSKSNKRKRLDYILPFINNIEYIIKMLEERDNIGGIFPDLLLIGNQTIYYNGEINLKIKFNNIHWGNNQTYMNEILDYLDINGENREYLFPEGNFYIIDKKISLAMYSDLMLYNILNSEDSFDYQWIKTYYHSNKPFSELYNEYVNKDYYGNNLATKKGWEGLADCMIEHVFERLPITLCKKHKMDIYFVSRKTIDINYVNFIFGKFKYINHLKYLLNNHY
jgi:hypothetical protein